MRAWLLVLAVACGPESTPQPSGRDAPSATVIDAAPDAGLDAATGGALAAAPDAAPARSSYREAARLVIPDLEWVQRLAVQSDGKLLVVGDKGVVRANADFTLD